MTSGDPRDINNPVFVRFYRRTQKTAVKRGEASIAAMSSRA